MTRKRKPDTEPDRELGDLQDVAHPKRPAVPKPPPKLKQSSDGFLALGRPTKAQQKM